MNENDGLEQTIRELRDANRALAEEVRAFCKAVADGYREQDRRRKRFALLFLVVFYTIPFVAILAGKLLIKPTGEDPWARQDRQDREQRDRLDRSDRALGRAEQLLDRLEKAAPPK